MSLTTKLDIFTNRAKGLGWSYPIFTAGASGTGAAAASGFINANILFNAIGTTAPGTLVGFPIPAPGASLFTVIQHIKGLNANIVIGDLALIYKMGTVDLANAAAAPYDGFTHNSNWSGTLQRTNISGASQNVPLIPLIYVTTATTTTAPAFILQTSAAGAGYVNQSGSNVIGSKTFTFPNVATATGSSYILRLEDGDSAIQDMTQMSVTIKSSTGAATIFGMEPICSINSPYLGGINDAIFGGFDVADITLPTPTSGTLTVDTDVFLVLINYSNAGTIVTSGYMEFVKNA